MLANNSRQHRYADQVTAFQPGAIIQPKDRTPESTSTPNVRVTAASPTTVRGRPGPQVGHMAPSQVEPTSDGQTRGRYAALAVDEAKRKALYAQHATLASKVALGEATRAERNQYQLLCWQIDQDETARLAQSFSLMEEFTEQLERLAETVSSTVDKLRPPIRVKSTTRPVRMGKHR